ncbi:MAG: hypothetical protein L6R37_007986, partial [Teloschistes peruensis]
MPSTLELPGVISPISARSPLAPALPLREYTIMQLVNAITDKPGWQRKVHDDTIVARWRAEAAATSRLSHRALPAKRESWDSEDARSQWSAERSADLRPVDVSAKMINWAIDEVKYKAKLFPQINCVEALDGVWKSDSIIDEELRSALVKAVQPLEDVPEIVGKAVPLWDRVLSRPISPPMSLRVSDWSNYEETNTLPEQEESEDDDDFDERYEEWQETLLFYNEPEPGTFRTPAERVKGYIADRPFDVPGLELQDEAEKLSFDMEPCVNLRRDFRRLEIIVKLANIHLTPEKPKYAGGSWHVEAQANESICASAIYYYSSENITASYLSFRHQVDEHIELPFSQNSILNVEDIFGVKDDSPAIHDLGEVLTQESRLLCFPNVIQHRVSPFRLADSSKPGHRKILALFLVDPNLKIISTENVPPQQHSWWREMVETAGIFEKLPPALAENVSNSDGFPLTLEKAKQQRLELMDERKSFVKWHDDQFVSRSSFS